jgi:hypothetical protein
MPRFANIKGSMNPFDNNKPVLSSSDRLKNKRNKTIYQAEKQRFQNKRCGKNVRYYSNGTVRSTNSYALHNGLARGYALCDDCNGKGNLCGTVNKNDLVRIHMGNNLFSEYWGGSTIIPDASFNGVNLDVNYSQAPGFPVIQSDISGTWGSSTNPKKNLSNYGFIDNIIDIPLNLNGQGVVIDPSNILFSDNNCGVHSYFRRHANIKTNIVLRGTIDLSFNITVDPLPVISFGYKSSCNDPSYNSLVGSYVQLVNDPGPFALPNVFKNISGVFYGQINKICCLGYLDNIPQMDIHITVNTISNYGILNQLINDKAIFKPGWVSSGPLLHEFGPFNWVLPWALVVYKKDADAVFSVTLAGYFETIRIFQGDCQENQTTGNETKQNYMSCLSDGTKKINFT